MIRILFAAALALASSGAFADPLPWHPNPDGKSEIGTTGIRMFRDRSELDIVWVVTNAGVEVGRYSTFQAAKAAAEALAMKP